MSGVTLAMHYDPNVEFAFDSVEHPSKQLSLQCAPLLLKKVSSVCKEEIYQGLVNIKKESKRDYTSDNGNSDKPSLNSFSDEQFTEAQPNPNYDQPSYGAHINKNYVTGLIDAEFALE